MTFPKVMVCSQSMHSRARKERFYPNVNDSMLSAFYGSFIRLNGLEREEWEDMVYDGTYLKFATRPDIRDSWKELIDIDLRGFFNKTKPPFAGNPTRVRNQIQINLNFKSNQIRKLGIFFEL